MKIALANFEITDSIPKNIKTIMQLINTAASNNADMIIFPEDCVTGLRNNDKPEHDIKLGLTIRSTEILTIRELARELDIIVVLGFLEIYDDKLYDSCIVIHSNTLTVDTYRRISRGWHGPAVSPNFYGHGAELKRIDTKIGTFTILLCGDLFDDDLVEQAKNIDAEFLIYPMLRDSYPKFKAYWWEEEFEKYRERLQMIGKRTFMINGLINSKGYKTFGGGWVLDELGIVEKHLYVFKPGIIYYNSDDVFIPEDSALDLF
ncbi:MAG: carbon-nitrogen hydrolase family protein [Candidatus Delongbacteria bacterium]|jgi:predicted amidohydrolase|nr:carbon-nitrogen hydrolase family protein [Candidatus Delongbacteria bacterium]